MRHLSYLAMLLGCLAAVVPLELLVGARVLRRPLRLLLTLLAVATPFVLWDVAATHAGHWSFDHAQTLSVSRIAGLPVEEWGFFVVIPLAVVLTLEAVRTMRTGARRS